jgi:hypothetical protein
LQCIQPCGDGPFQVLERINCNAYKTDLLGEYGVSATFNVGDFTFFNIGFDSRSNPFEERRDGVDQQGPSFEGFNQIRFEGSIEVSREGPNTSYPCARGVQSNLIWAMR